MSPRDKCAGDLMDQPGVRSYGLRPADERYDVYCYIDGLKGGFLKYLIYKYFIYRYSVNTNCLFLYFNP